MVSTASTFDEQQAHARFSAACFNAAWELIDKERRTEEEALRMLDLAHASLWHWTERTNCTPTNLSVGYWQLARVNALLNEANLARRYGRMALDLANETEFFHRAFAQEALARAEMVAGNAEAMDRHLAEARRLAEKIADAEGAAWLQQNLATIGLERKN
jgi:hypothetical protein